MATRVTPEESPHPNPWANPAGLVFVGFRVGWRRRLSDFATNERLAAKWETSSSTWQTGSRSIDLAVPLDGYFVRLSDGQAYFRTESSAAYELALQHLNDLVGNLVHGRRQKATATVEAQFLVPVEDKFEGLVARLGGRVLKQELQTALSFDLLDFAYMADVTINGRWHQINFGPVRSHEVRGRVAAVTIKEVPDVAIFCSITAKNAFDYEERNVPSSVMATVEVGNAVVRELLK